MSEKRTIKIVAKELQEFLKTNNLVIKEYESLYSEKELSKSEEEIKTTLQAGFAVMGELSVKKIMTLIWQSCGLIISPWHVKTLYSLSSELYQLSYE